MNKTKNSKTAKREATPAPASAAAAAPSEHYERRDDGFYLVKTLKDGTVTVTQLSNFIAEIISERHKEHERPNGEKNRWLDCFVVQVRFRDYEKGVFVDASTFRKSLLDEVLKVHPMAKVYPGKREHVETAIITLSDAVTVSLKSIGSNNEISAPRIIGKHGADSKSNNKQSRKGSNREA